MKKSLGLLVVILIMIAIRLFEAYGYIRITLWDWDNDGTRDCLIFIPSASGHLWHNDNGQVVESEGNLALIDTNDTGYIAFQSDSRTISVVRVSQNCKLG